MRNPPKRPTVGQKNGKITVLQFGPEKSPKGKTLWKCECDCGKIIWRTGGSLSRFKKSSCNKCVEKPTREKHHSWKGFEEIPGSFLSHIKAGAKARNIECSISIENLWRLYEKQQKKCALSGLPISFYKLLNRKSDSTASLDRIDSSKGYTLDNVQWVHKDINRMKNSFNQEYFISICRYVSEHNLK